MPENAVYVGRPSKWSNFWKIGYPSFNYGIIDLSKSLKLFEEDLNLTLKEHPDFLDPLKGKDLACYCPLDKPCHADIILKILEKQK